MSEVLIGRGKTARVYKIDGSPHNLVRKEFSPIHPVRLWNRFFYNSPHPLTTEAGHIYAYWKRRIAHRLCNCLNYNAYIPDALHIYGKGFTARFIDGSHPTKKDKRIIYSAIRKLEDAFDYIGMPTWSFSRRNPFSGSNFILKDGTICIIDYEQSVPVLDSRGCMGYDRIYFDDVHNFISGTRHQILDKLGIEETKNLDQAFEIAKESHGRLNLRPKKITKFVNIVRRK